MQRKWFLGEKNDCIKFFENNIKTYVYLDNMFTKKLQKLQKVANEYFCEKCDYKCSNLFNFNKHCATRRHQDVTNVTNDVTEKIGNHICSQCHKTYASRMGLWRHHKVCKTIETENNPQNQLIGPANGESMHNYIMLLLEQNQELKKELVELAKNQNTTIIHNNNTTNNSKTINNTQFNLNVFLQERCKDALNMSQFIDTLEINPQSVEYTGAHGYVNGITKIFMDGLNQLDIHERPIHCTDLKRETLYIKENDKWEKDTEEKTKFKHALATVVNRNIAQVSHWEKENPRSQIPETEEYEFYFDIVRQSLGGGNHDVTARNNDKILRAIAGKVYLDKKCKELL